MANESTPHLWQIEFRYKLSTIIVITPAINRPSAINNAAILLGDVQIGRLSVVSAEKYNKNTEVSE